MKPAYLMINNRYEKFVAGSETYTAIRKSKQNSSHVNLILGDSECYQLFPNTKDFDSTLSLACNQAIGMVGHYLLLLNYLNANNEINNLYMIFGPEGLSNNLDQIYTFHYFLKPFYKDEYKPYFTELVNKQISKIPYRKLCREPYIMTSNWAPKLSSTDNVDLSFISPITNQYLHKILQLSEEKNFKLHIISAPIKLSRARELEKIYKDEIINSDLHQVMNSYFENILYLPDTCFLDDGVHLRNPENFVNYYRNNWIDQSGD